MVSFIFLFLFFPQIDLFLTWLNFIRMIVLFYHCYCFIVTVYFYCLIVD